MCVCPHCPARDQQVGQRCIDGQIGCKGIGAGDEHRHHSTCRVGTRPAATRHRPRIQLVRTQCFGHGDHTRVVGGIQLGNRRGGIRTVFHHNGALQLVVPGGRNVFTPLTPNTVNSTNPRFFLLGDREFRLRRVNGVVHHRIRRWKQRCISRLGGGNGSRVAAGQRCDRLLCFHRERKNTRPILVFGQRAYRTAHWRTSNGVVCAHRAAGIQCGDIGKVRRHGVSDDHIVCRHHTRILGTQSHRHALAGNHFAAHRARHRLGCCQLNHRRHRHRHRVLIAARRAVFVKVHLLHRGHAITQLDGHTIGLGATALHYAALDGNRLGGAGSQSTQLTCHFGTIAATAAGQRRHIKTVRRWQVVNQSHSRRSRIGAVVGDGHGVGQFFTGIHGIGRSRLGHPKVHRVHHGQFALREFGSPASLYRITRGRKCKAAAMPHALGLYVKLHQPRHTLRQVTALAVDKSGLIYFCQI